jgi:peptidoglycan/LPS O-acetylase OafA/YrhL
LPNLDGLRCVGALAILFIHIEDIKEFAGKAMMPWGVFAKPLGNHAVSLFFVLSGFIITYLLLKEKEHTGTINLKNFYIRRILKIWPLYYLIVLVGFFVLPHLDTFFSVSYSPWKNGPLFKYALSALLFLPAGAVGLLGGKFPTIGATWTVRVEEAFYLFWPVLLKRSKNYVRVMVIIIIAVMLARYGFAAIALVCHYRLLVPGAVKTIWLDLNDYRFSCMAFGALGAYFVVSDNKKILNVLFRKDLQWLVYVVAALLLLIYRKHESLLYEPSSALFAIMIMNLAANPNTVIKLDYKPLNYLGKISYGIYLYNPIMRILGLELTEKLFGDVIGWQANLLFYTLSVAFTIVVSAISYEFFEKYFLRMKGRFA